MDPVIPFLAVLLAVFVTRILRLWWNRRSPVLQAAKKATRAASSSKRASWASARLSETSCGFSFASSEASNRAMQSAHPFARRGWHVYARFLLYCSLWYLGRSMQLRDR